MRTYKCIYDNLVNLKVDENKVSLDIVIKDDNNSVREIHGGVSGKLIDEVAPLKYNEESLKGLLKTK